MQRRMGTPRASTCRPWVCCTCPCRWPNASSVPVSSTEASASLTRRLPHLPSPEFVFTVSIFHFLMYSLICVSHVWYIWGNMCVFCLWVTCSLEHVSVKLVYLEEYVCFLFVGHLLSDTCISLSSIFGGAWVVLCGIGVALVWFG